VLDLLSAVAPALSLLSVSKRFDATQALEDVDLAVGRGEVVALMGANGAGKSTLAKIAAGVIRADSGRILVSGRELRLTSPQSARTAGIVIVHQSTDQLGVPGLTVAENLMLYALCGGGGGAGGAIVSQRRIARQARGIADSIGFDASLEQDFGVLGPAHRQLVAIARAVAAEAPVLILDEPTASLSAPEADRLFAVVDRLRERGVGVLYISHRLGDIRRIADRIVVLRNGRRVADQAKPFDFAAAVRTMIGRNLDDAARAADSGIASEIVLRMSGTRLIPGAASFDLVVRAGEVVAVTGALGSGKSRLLRALYGIESLAGGSIELAGAPWRPISPAHSIAHGVFMAAEDRWRSSFLPAVTPGADIAGTIALPHRRSWFPWGLLGEERERAAADTIIRRLDVRCRSSEDTLDLLSGGNQQKVVIGRWQSAPCRLLLLDEPFQGVDVGARQDIVDAIRADRRDGATLIATSDVEEAIEAADVVAVMRDHSIVGLHDLKRSSGESLISAIAALETIEPNHERESAA
jgi:simple sugar transport system ATP-binding protein